MRVLMLVSLALAACSTDPVAQEAERIEDAAEARADAIRADADNRAAMLGNQAESMVATVADPQSHDGRVAATRAEALRKEAQLIRERGRAQAEAAESAGEAQADAVRAR